MAVSPRWHTQTWWPLELRAKNLAGERIASLYHLATLILEIFLFCQLNMGWNLFVLLPWRKTENANAPLFVRKTTGKPTWNTMVKTRGLHHVFYQDHQPLRQGQHLLSLIFDLSWACRTTSWDGKIRVETNRNAKTKRHSWDGMCFEIRVFSGNSWEK